MQINMFVRKRIRQTDFRLELTGQGEDIHLGAAEVCLQKQQPELTIAIGLGQRITLANSVANGWNQEGGQTSTSSHRRSIDADMELGRLREGALSWARRASKVFR